MKIAHEFLAGYSIYSRHLLKIISNGGNEIALKTNIAEILALIELECDAFAALTLAYLNKNPLAFIEGMEKIGRDFSNYELGFHPPDSVRRRLVEQIIPEVNQKVKSQFSDDLMSLKKSVSENSLLRR